MEHEGGHLGFALDQRFCDLLGSQQQPARSMKDHDVDGLVLRG
jgi:hypothetical protein